MEKAWHSLTKEETLSELDTGEEGLTDAEVGGRLEEFGPNELDKKDGTSPLKILLEQFKDVLIIILIIAALISAGIGLFQGTPEELIDAAVIMLIVIVIAVLGFFQEYKAEKTIQALKELASPKVNVIRGGEEREIPSKEVVPGDVMLLKTGDKISADGRLIESVNLKVNEASLTGESLPVSKVDDEQMEEDSIVGERKNMVFSGCTVEYGRGKAVVTETGMSTELGKIADLIQTEPEKTPLQKKLAVLGKQLGIGVLLISVFIFTVGLIQNVEIVEMFLTAVSLAVAAIPEGLPAVVTISLALGLQRMAKRNALVRRLPAVESLGSATVVCTDKTGTLTKGEMNIREIYAGAKRIEVSGEGFEPEGNFFISDQHFDPMESRETQWLLKAGMLCNDSNLVKEEGKWNIKGDTTEGTLLVAGRKAGLSEREAKEQYPRVFELPFDSNKKRMTTVHEHDGSRLAFMKGAPESVLPLCNRICVDGEVGDLKEGEKSKLLEENEEMAGRALRILALAMKPVEGEISEETLESEMIFLGLVGMIDSPRKEAIKAIKVSKKAGIRVIMITGDHALTAKAIAKEMGIVGEEEPDVLTGGDLDEMDPEELSERVKDASIFARVSPEHKVKIVDALKANGEIVAMTGDGVNDAPALKKADVGVAMGITGTDVSKEASEMILLDDNFASIISATEEGRGIYDNIKKFVGFLLSCNSGEVATMFAATLIFIDPELMPFLLPVQILWINLVTDSFPALALGVEKTDPEVMNRAPRDPEESTINREMVYRIVIMGIIMAVGTLLSFHVVYEIMDSSLITARTVAFCTLVMSQLFYVFSMRSENKTLVSVGITSNMKLIYAVLVSIGLQLVVVYTPFMNPIFKTAPIGIQEWLIIAPIAFSVFIISEIWKIIKRRMGSHSQAQEYQ